MTKLLPPKQRVDSFLTKLEKQRAWRFEDCPDRRDKSKIEHPIQTIIWAMLWALIANRKTLRDAESLTKELAGSALRQVPKSISDTTLDRVAKSIPEHYLLDKLVQQIRAMHRSKRLKPQGVPWGVATIDGKNIATLSNNPNGQGHPRDIADEKWKRLAPASAEGQGDYYLFPALRATLSSNAATPAIYHMPLPPGTSESTCFHRMLDELHHAYGHLELFRVIDVDAGFTSWNNAQLVSCYGYYYLMGLKDNQPTLMESTKRLFLGHLAYNRPPLAQTCEKRNGKTVRRSLWVSNRLEDAVTSAGQWTDLTQVWFVRQETEGPDGDITLEDRYFLTSIPAETVTGEQILWMVRRHWAVENDVFNSLDLQWREDSAPWITKGNGIGVLGILRLMAFNVVQFLRKRHLCRKKSDGSYPKPLPWRDLFEKITEVLKGFIQAETQARRGAATL